MGEPDDVSMLVLDEVSQLSPQFVHHSNKRLQVLLGCGADFGGLLVIFA